jgi:hypothetical protein
MASASPHSMRLANELGGAWLFGLGACVEDAPESSDSAQGMRLAHRADRMSTVDGTARPIPGLSIRQAHRMG